MINSEQGTNDSYGSGLPSSLNPSVGAGSRDSRDRTGHLEEGAALYERSTDHGPVTGGAPNTDMFDTDKPRHTSGLTGHGTGKTHNYDGTNPQNASFSGSEDPDKQQSGGAAGIVSQYNLTLFLFQTPLTRSSLLLLPRTSPVTPTVSARVLTTMTRVSSRITLVVLVAEAPLLVERVITRRTLLAV